MHPLLMPFVVASFMGNPVISRVTTGEAFHTQLQPQVLMMAPAVAPVSKPFPTEKLQPKWSGTIAGYGLTVTPKRETGGFKVDFELSW
jgi:hypothetical protein